jgi:hypothetical protein
MKIQIPQGLEVPESGTVDLVTTFQVANGELMPVAIDGITLPEQAETEEGEETEMEETEMESPEAPEEAGPQKPGGSPDSFMAAIEEAMSKSKGQKMK